MTIGSAQMARGVVCEGLQLAFIGAQMKVRSEGLELVMFGDVARKVGT